MRAAGGYFIACLILIAGTGASAADRASAGEFQYEILDAVSTYDMWHSGCSTISSAANAIIQYCELSHESALSNGDWKPQAVILAATGDVGVQPVGIKIWSKVATSLRKEESEKISAQGERAIAIARPRLRECMEEPRCAATKIQITANDNGEVFLNETLVGKFH